PEYSGRKKAFLARLGEIEGAIQLHGLSTPEVDVFNRLRKVTGWSERCAMKFKYNKLSSEFIDELIAEAEGLGVDEKFDQLVRLQEIREQDVEWVSAATKIMQDRDPIDLRQVGKLLEKGRNMEILPEGYDELRNLQQKALDLQASADKIVDLTESNELVQRPRYSEAVKLLKDTKSFGRFEPSNLDRLSEEIDKVDKWAAEMRHMLEPVAKHYAVSVDKVLEYAQSHLRRAIDAITRESNDGAKTDDSAARYCICLQPEHGLMVECEHCREWYHIGCVGLETEDIDNRQFECRICTAAITGTDRLTLMDDYLQLDQLENSVTECRKLGLISPELDPMVTFLLDAWALTKTIKDFLAKGITDQSEGARARRAVLLRTTLRAMFGLGIGFGQDLVDELWRQLLAVTKEKQVAAPTTTTGVAPADSMVQLTPSLPEQQQTNEPEQPMPQHSAQSEDRVQNTPIASEAEAKRVASVPESAPASVSSSASASVSIAPFSEATQHKYADNKQLYHIPNEMSVSEGFRKQLENIAYLVLEPPSEEDDHGQGLVAACD
ncbi:hypothetical protein LPJ57_009339, partial [Coemansia sp. RSA 486]